MGRSLRSSKEGLAKAKKAFKLKGWTQDHLAGRADCSRTTAVNFFARRPVAKQLFQNLCIELGLECGEIAELETDKVPERSPDLDELIASVRKDIRDSIREKCGFMRVLDMTQPIGMNDIYTDVNILEKITGRRRLDIPELLEQSGVKDFERFSLSDIREERVPGLEAVEKHSKLMILGKPGAGKTTFLKHLAIQCVEERFKPKLVPLFITLKDFAEAPEQPSLLDYLSQLFISCGVDLDTKKAKEKALKTLTSSYDSSAESLLYKGKVLVLLDGLDEVKESDNSRVLQQIQSFTSQFHKNSFVITCRIAAKGYTFEQFTEVEVADFDNRQIETFSTKWFQSKQDTVKAKTFMGRLQRDKGIRELATSPILLTLLCLVFEESGTFPANRSELYKEGLDVLLKKWDVKRNIERDQVYKQLSLKRKEDLLSQIAIDTFEPGNYFFKQKEVERRINDYIRNLPGANIEEDVLQTDSEVVLKSIEAQHGLLVERARGIYSFSHLTFHEYFTARKLVSSTKSDIFAVRLLPHLNEKRWREVFLLTVGMVESADDLLLKMKQQVEGLIATDDRIQQLLIWVERKRKLVNAPYKPAAARSFYFALSHAPNLSLFLDRVLDLAFSLDRALAFDLDSSLSSRDLDLDLFLFLSFDRARDLDHACALARDPTFQRSLQALKDKLPSNSNENRKQFTQWWTENGTAWAEELRAVMIQHRDVGHDWQFSTEQEALLQQYYDANKLLVSCLNSDCYVSREVRQEIEESLLLPTQSGD